VYPSLSFVTSVIFLSHILHYIHITISPIPVLFRSLSFEYGKWFACVLDAFDSIVAFHIARDRVACVLDCGAGMRHVIVSTFQKSYSFRWSVVMTWKPSVIRRTSDNLSSYNFACDANSSFVHRTVTSVARILELLFRNG
jgi:hypothetical protein